MNKKQQHLYIEGLKLKIRDCASEDHETSWGMQEGILISKADAKALLDLINSRQPAEPESTIEALKKEVEELKENLDIQKICYKEVRVLLGLKPAGGNTNDAIKALQSRIQELEAGKEEVWNNACKATLSDIKKCFSDNLHKADFNDQPVLEGIVKTIEGFPLPTSPLTP